MKRLFSWLLAGVLLAFGLGVPLVLMGWHIHDAWERRATLQGPAHPATVISKRTVWGGRGRGTIYYATVKATTAAPAEIEVSDDDYDSLQPGQSVAVNTHPTSHRQLLSTTPWWTWKHLWWIVFGAALTVYFIRIALAQLRPAKAESK